LRQLQAVSSLVSLFFYSLTILGFKSSKGKPCAAKNCRHL
jgi:hypothetical protein